MQHFFSLFLRQTRSLADQCRKLFGGLGYIQLWGPYRHLSSHHSLYLHPNSVVSPLLADTAVFHRAFVKKMLSPGASFELKIYKNAYATGASPTVFLTVTIGDSTVR